MVKVWILLCLLLIIAPAKINPQILKARQYYEVKRMACFILSKYYYFMNNEIIQSIIIELDSNHQVNFQNKKLPIAIEYCMNQISYEKARKLIFHENGKEPSHFMQVFDNFSYKQILQNQQPLTLRQESILKFIKGYDEEMQIQKEEKQARNKEREKSLKPEIKIFGVSTQQIPFSAQIFYLALVFGLLIVGFLYIKKMLVKIERKERQSKKKKLKEIHKNRKQSYL